MAVGQKCKAAAAGREVDKGQNMTSAGHSKVFCSIDDSEDPEYATNQHDVSENPEYANNHHDGTNIYDWITMTYRESRGSELPGTVNPAVIENLFRQPTSNWGRIAKTYLKDVNVAMNKFIVAVVEDIIVDPTVQTSLQARLLPLFNQATEHAQCLLATALDDERGGVLQTVNHYFADNLMKARENRVVARFQKLGIRDGEYQVTDLKALTDAAHLSNETQAAYDIHDILKAYYKVAIKRFMDIIVIGVVERSLLGPFGFTSKFDAQFVSNMNEEELAAVTAENQSTTTTRSELKEKLSRFEQALRIAKSV